VEIKIEFNAKSIISFFVLFLIVIFYLKLQNVINIFAIAFLIAYILIPLVHFVEKRLRIGRTLSVLLIFSFFSLIVVAVFILFVPFLYAEILNMLKNFPSYFDNLNNRFDKLMDRTGYSIDLSTIKIYLMEKVSEHSAELLKGSFNIIGNIITSVSGLFGFFIVPVLVFYFLKDFEFILKKGIDFVSERFNIDLTYYNEQFNSVLKGYFRGQILVCFFLGLMYGLLDMVVGIKGGFAIGFISGMLSFVPYLGFIAGFVTSSIMAYLQFGDIIHPLIVIVGFMVIQSIESYFLTPKLVGEHLGLHPIAVIFALFAGASLMGIGGMILSIPVVAFIKIVIKRYLENGTFFVDK